MLLTLVFEEKRRKAMARKKVQAAEKTETKTAEAYEKAAAPEKKAAAEVKKPVGRKPVKRTEMKTSVSVQYMGKDISDKEMIALIKKDWTAKKRKVSEIKTMELYVKVEENMVYYVINGEETGSVAI
ncbi:hypothetical protein H9Q78_10345 [Qiania dongpingensis]|uniref:Uncharacterized protein n=2 Tax=Qiania dongpingensis TaxID=2763669 RepID=A0A7G9G8B5_9FIRM|nr:hypothetical protein H9Q78_10345 [Qiania dongpingensis]